MKRKHILTLLLILLLTLSTALPALAEVPPGTPTVIDETKTGSLTLYKYEVVDPAKPGTSPATGAAIENVENEHTKPLAGVTFTIRRTHDIYGNEITGAPTLERTTDAAGKAVFADLSLGIYLVTETKSPENVTQKTAPFSIGVPITNPTGDGWLYDVVVYPKNVTVYGAVILNKSDEGGSPIAGAKFDFQKFDEAKQTWTTLEQFTTNANGQIALKNLPAGLYRFVETEAPAPYLNSTPEGLPFQIDHTGAIAETNGKFLPGEGAVQVNVTNFAPPTVTKDIEGTTDKGKAQGADAVWNVRISLPANAETYDKLVLTDRIPAALGFRPETLRITATGAARAGGTPQETALIKDTDYRASFAPATGELTVTFRDADFAGTLAGKRQLVVSYNAPIQPDAPLGTPIGLGATVSASCGCTRDIAVQSGVPEVHMGGVCLWKYASIEGAKTALAGARFAIFRSEADARAGRDAIGTAVSNSAGVVAFSGLAYGADGVTAAAGSTKYWVAETAAPTVNGVRYNLLPAPVAVTVSASSYTAADSQGRPAVQVENRSGFELPVTGGTGTLLFTVGGVLLMLAAAAVLLLRRRAERQK